MGRRGLMISLTQTSDTASPIEHGTVHSGSAQRSLGSRPWNSLNKQKNWRELEVCEETGQWWTLRARERTALDVRVLRRVLTDGTKGISVGRGRTEAA